MTYISVYFLEVDEWRDRAALGREPGSALEQRDTNPVHGSGELIEPKSCPDVWFPSPVVRPGSALNLTTASSGSRRSGSELGRRGKADARANEGRLRRKFVRGWGWGGGRVFEIVPQNHAKRHLYLCSTDCQVTGNAFHHEQVGGSKV